MPPFSSVMVVGCGLIGSSLLRTVRAAWPEVALTAVEQDAAAREYLQANKLADNVTAQVESGAQLIIIAVPIQALGAAAEAISRYCGPGVTVTDISSVKMAAIEAIAPKLPAGAVFIPGHPIAGSEKTGPQAGTADLFKGKRVILTPEQPEGEALERVAAFWRGLGAHVAFMPAALHDRVYACVSHLPQLLAFHMRELGAEFGGRIGASDSTLWHGIFDANKNNINNVLEMYLQALHQIISELKEGQGEANAAAAREVFPYVAASCLVSVAAREERAIGTCLSEFAGAGFADFTAPLSAEPEAMLERISACAPSVVVLLEKFADLLKAWR